MTDKQISEAEVKIIRWGEKILTPLLVAMILGMAAWVGSMNDSIAQLAGEHDRYNDNNAVIKSEVTKINDKLDRQNNSQQQLELSVKRIETRQEYYKDQIQDVKEQNAQILKLLRDERNQ